MNPFAVLGLPERAALSAEEVKARFLELSAQHHPDRQTSPAAPDRNRFTEVNLAYQQLHSTGGRIKALLEHRFPESFELKGRLPEGLIGLFSKVGATLQEADAFLAKKAKANTNLAEALLAPAMIKTQGILAEAAGQVKERLDAVEARLPEIDALLERDDSPEALALASVLCREALYLEKWRSQIQERFHQLL